MNVVENGTARRAALDGITAGGKTGTTNGFRDAWFVGFTGNFVAAVWYGNDDYQPLHNMTGGSLPAMTWHKVMTFAHQGVKPVQLPGVKRNMPNIVSAQGNPIRSRNGALPPRAVEQLRKLERALRDVRSNAASAL